MNLRRAFFGIIALAVFCAGAYQTSALSQTHDVVVKVTSVGDRPIRFRGAVMFREGGLQIIDGQTPFEVRGRGNVAFGMFERVGDGPEIQVELSAGPGSASGTAGRVIVGHDLVRGVTAFARTLQ